MHVLQPLIDRALREDFGAFVARVFQTVCPGQAYLPGWHIDLMGEYLTACARGEIARLVMNVPPRSLKSICASVAWPAWVMGHDPTRRLMAASYAQGLATKHSVDCRLVMESEWYRRVFPDTQLSRDQNEKHKFVTTQRGMRMATSVWGTATGEGGSLLIADDPINPLQAQSSAMRQFVNDWFDHTFASRLDDKRTGAVVVVMQRLHPEDLSGHVLRKGGWEHLCLPAIATQDERWQRDGRRWQRAKGELLHPAREGVAEMARARAELGSRQFEAQYQQQPLAQESAMVKLEWFGRF